MNNLRNSTMSRQGAIARAEHHFDSGAFKADLARRVAIPSESQNPQRGADLRRYIDEEMKPALDALGFACRVLTHPKAKGPFLFAERIENPLHPTVLGYGHGDVIRGFEGSGSRGATPGSSTSLPGAIGAAAPPTTRASTPSISPPSMPFSPSGASSASMPSG